MPGKGGVIHYPLKQASLPGVQGQGGEHGDERAVVLGVKARGRGWVVIPASVSWVFSPEKGNFFTSVTVLAQELRVWLMKDLRVPAALRMMETSSPFSTSAWAVPGMTKLTGPGWPSIKSTITVARLSDRMMS